MIEKTQNENITVYESGTVVKTENGVDTRKKVHYIHPQYRSGKIDLRPFWYGFFKK